MGASSPIRLASISLCFVLAACSGQKNPPPLGGDGGTRHDGGTPTNPWTTSIVDTGGVGLGLQAAVSSGGKVAAAYWVTQGVTSGQCPYTPPEDKIVWDLKYATRGSNGDWKVETVGTLPVVGQPRGLSLGFGADGVPRLAATGGPVEPPGPDAYCGSNDADLYTRTGAGTWSDETAAATSTDAVVPPPGDPSYDVGPVVGDWPALAFDSKGEPAIAYRDVHFGGIQSIDNKRSDLELAWKRGGGWTDLPVDMGRGAGLFMSLAFDTSDRPVIGYQVQYQTATGPKAGVFAARSDAQGQNFQTVQLSTATEEADPSVAVSPSDGSVWVAWYDAGDGFAHLGQLTDPTQFADVAKGWALQRLGDKRYDEGEHPSLAFAPDGRVALAWYRCTLATGGIGNCNTNDDGVVFAWNDGTSWHEEMVDAGGDGNCGMSPSLVFTPDGHAVIVYQCSVRTGPSTFDLQVFAAEREPLP